MILAFLLSRAGQKKFVRSRRAQTELLAFKMGRARPINILYQSGCPRAELLIFIDVEQDKKNFRLARDRHFKFRPVLTSNILYIGLKSIAKASRETASKISRQRGFAMYLQ